VSIPSVSQPAAPARATQGTGLAMAVIMTGVPMTAVDGQAGPGVRPHRLERDELGYDQTVMDLVFHTNAERVLGL
jgi:hypothetical protein